MLSKEMYAVLSCFPRKLGKSIKYEDLVSKCNIEENDIIECLDETLFAPWNYIRSSDGWNNGSELFITESGLSKIEEYEDSVIKQKISKRALMVSVFAMITSIISVVVAIFSLLL